MNYEKYNNMNLEELENAKNELFGEIQTEKAWMFASKGKKELQHAMNVDILRAELRYVIDKIDSLKND
jgi:hypothetical protein